MKKYNIRLTAKLESWEDWYYEVEAESLEEAQKIAEEMRRMEDFKGELYNAISVDSELVEIIEAVVLEDE